MPRRWWTRLVLAGVILAALLAPAAWANHQFSDVPTASPHHANVSTIARVGITGGCATGLYCPANNVRRDEMASFVARTLRATTPVWREDDAILGAIDPDAVPVICQTANFTPAVQTRAFVHVRAAFQQAVVGSLGWFVEGVWSNNGGATWISLDGTAFNFATTHAAGDWSNADNMSDVFLTTGAPNRFGVRVGRVSGTSDASAARCEVSAQIHYNDAGTSLIGTSQPASADGQTESR